uniref:Uncharacterized protein n=1 Tax=Amphimedon queenslandica TaxID=400682 RepID=A0A1X7U1I8_AMPQE
MLYLIIASIMLNSFTILQVHCKHVQFTFLLSKNLVYLECAVKLSLSRLFS